MTRGREVSTTSPRLASTRMFWIIFSSSASCRLAKAGSLRGTRRGCQPKLPNVMQLMGFEPRQS